MKKTLNWNECKTVEDMHITAAEISALIAISLGEKYEIPVAGMQEMVKLYQDFTVGFADTYHRLMQEGKVPPELQFRPSNQVKEMP